MTVRKFDLLQALSGRKVVSRDGKYKEPLQIEVFNHHPKLAFIAVYYSDGALIKVQMNGRALNDLVDCGYDLFMEGTA